MRAFADGDGGVVYASRNAVLWRRGPTVDSSVLLARVALPGDDEDGADHSLTLWDVDLFEGERTVLYSTRQENPDGSVEVQLYRAPLPGTAEVIQTFSWSTTAERTDLVGASLANDRIMTLQRYGNDACESVVFRNGQGDEIGASTLHPLPQSVTSFADGDFVCPGPRVAAAALSNDASTLATIEALGEDTVLVVSTPATGEIVLRTVLEPAGAAWDDVDTNGVSVVVSLGGGLAVDRWNVDDRTVVVDIGSSAATAVPLVGSTTLAAQNQSFDQLPSLDVGDPRAIATSVASLQLDEPDTDGSDPATPPDPVIAHPALTAVGRLENVVPADTFVGADGCAGPTDQAQVCAGMPLTDAATILDGLYGPALAEDPTVFPDGIPVGTSIWSANGVRVIVDGQDSVIGSISVFPADPTGLVSPFVVPVTIRDLTNVLGPPAQIFQSVTDDSAVVTFSYDTAAAFVGYSFVSLDPTSEPIDLSLNGVLDSVADTYFDLSITGYSAAPAG